MNFICAHDGFTLADLVSYRSKNNLANGELNRDGPNENWSWNNGVEGPSTDPVILANRSADVRALLATLFLVRGTPMLTAGDEFGRTQGGNNNAYAQDNASSWLDWARADQSLIAFTANLAELRRKHPAINADQFFTGAPVDETGIHDVDWLGADGRSLDAASWGNSNGVLGVALYQPGDRVLAWLNAGQSTVATVPLPETRDGFRWLIALDSTDPDRSTDAGLMIDLPPRSVVVLTEAPSANRRRPSPPDAALIEQLAGAAGIAADWWDISGNQTIVPQGTKQALLGAMGLPAATSVEARDSLVRLQRQQLSRTLPGSFVAGAGAVSRLPVVLPAHDGLRRMRVRIGADRSIDIGPADLKRVARLSVAGEDFDRYEFALPDLPAGYRDVSIEGLTDTCRLIAAPDTCYLAPELQHGGSVFGLASHLYALRDRAGEGGIGDFRTLDRFGVAAAKAGAALVGIQPLHHLFPTDRSRRSPYSPSDRRFIDPIHCHVHGFQQTPGAGFVDYAGVWAAKRAELWQRYRQFDASHADDYSRFVAEQGVALQRHATFEALAERAGSVDRSRWPVEWRSIESPEVAKFAQFQADAVGFHAWLQWFADRQLAEAARAARGLPLGIYRDLAVGCAPDGGEVFADPARFMTGISVGAPPDPFSKDGQVWNLPPFNPLGLARDGAQAFAEIVRANMRHAGVLRIDHILGLARLFLVPDGAKPGEGAYVAQPLETMLGVLAVESHRTKTTVVGEDLGTVPDGLADRLCRSNILSYRVLWFERDGAAFRPKSVYPRLAASCVSTHDLPTFKGWLGARDIAIDHQLGRIDRSANAERELARAQGIEALRQHLRGAGIDPGDTDDELMIAAHVFLAGSPSAIVLVQVDDLAGETEPLNVPGTDRDWQNWVRRIGTPVEDVLDSELARRLLAAVSAARARSGHL